MKTQNRETYLGNAITELRPLFILHGFPIPKLVKVTCGWPSKSAGRSSKRRIGECWDKTASADKKTINIIISMVIDSPLEALDVLAHELVHAAVGNECGHRGPFKTLARAIGLEGKLTATTAGPELEKHLKGIVKTLGKYPHSKIDFDARKKQTTRMIKVECQNIVNENCGMIFRTTRRWVDAIERHEMHFNCPICGGPCNHG
jgi:hypothetical protein